MFPLQEWLPTAHPVAPAPASAVLSGIITKAGVLFIVRILFFIVGTDFIKGTWLQYTSADSSSGILPPYGVPASSLSPEARNRSVPTG